MSKNGFFPIILLLIFAIPLAFFMGYFISPKSSPISNLPIVQKEQIFAEKIPGSKFHSPDGTWWGYNQSKIVRYKDKIFSSYIDNDDSNKTTSRFVILKKDGDSPWEEGANFPTSRPGNLLIDSKGVLHAFVFEPFNVLENDSRGRILHYWFPDAPLGGDIKNYQKELVVDNDGKSETANIRVGAAIGEDDTMAISFGLTKFNPQYKEQSEQIYYKKPTEDKWNHIFIDGLPHDYFYPFTLVSGNTFYLLTIQDDFAGANNPNIYQKIMYLEYANGRWKNQLVADLSKHPLAKERARMLEQEDLYKDKNGQIHILYKEFLNPDASYVATTHHHLIGSFGNFKDQILKFDVAGLNWIRLVDVEGSLYYLASSFDGLYIGKAGGEKLTEISIPSEAKGFYPYVATPKNGTKENKYIDVILLGSDQKLFQENKSTNYYIRIPKSEFTH